ncbi:hypothetical protein GCM10027614_25530 [Micromonospora vulcania]
MVFRAAVSGRVPVIGQHYRWFMRQQYLAPRQSVTFLGFAERLTAGWRDGEQPDQVNKLLLHAFLEDLRQAYRRRPWRPSDWRRTAYPVLLLDNVTPDNVGGALLRLIGDVRTETGRNDPLLVVASGALAPPELPEPHPLTDADEAYDEWAEALPEMRRLRRPAAWLVVLRPDDTDTGPPSRGGIRPFSAPEPPWWSRRFLPAALCLVLLASGGAWAGSRWGPGCHPRSPAAGSRSRWSAASASATATARRRCSTTTPASSGCAPSRSASSRRTAPPRRCGSAAIGVDPSSPSSTWAL